MEISSKDGGKILRSTVREGKKENGACLLGGIKKNTHGGEKTKTKNPKIIKKKNNKPQDIAAQVLSFHLSDSKRGIVAEEIWANP